MEAQDSVTLKRKKAERKSCWPEEFVEEVVNVCESEYYRKKLIFTNFKATKNLALYCKIVILWNSKGGEKSSKRKQHNFRFHSSSNQNEIQILHSHVPECVFET